MTKAEFIEKATECGYDEEQINEMIEAYDKTKKMLPDFDYSDIILIEQAVY